MPQARESIISRRMKNGVLGPDEGYDIVVDRVDLSFRDLAANAYEAATYLKLRRRKHNLVQVRDRAKGVLRTILPDGRVE